MPSPVAAGAVAAAVMYQSPMAVIVSHEFDLFAPFAHRAVTVRDGSCHTVESLPQGPNRLRILEQLARGEG